jgi:hypothetical protein
MILIQGPGSWIQDNHKHQNLDQIANTNYRLAQSVNTNNKHECCENAKNNNHKLDRNGNPQMLCFSVLCLASVASLSNKKCSTCKYT